jgi:hypothetical protein
MRSVRAASDGCVEVCGARKIVRGLKEALTENERQAVADHVVAQRQRARRPVEAVASTARSGLFLFANLRQLPLTPASPHGALTQMGDSKMKRIDVKHLDVVFIGNHNRYGCWVIMQANEKGRALIDALFPKHRFFWGTPLKNVPADWREHEINVATADIAAETELRNEFFDMTKNIDGDEIDPDAGARVIANAVSRQGGRAAVVLRNGRVRPMARAAVARPLSAPHRRQTRP